MFQSSPTPKRRCHVRLVRFKTQPHRVSILTDAETPVPLAWAVQIREKLLSVSILTDAETPVPLETNFFEMF